jgi:hypothetical protein
MSPASGHAATGVLRSRRLRVASAIETRPQHGRIKGDGCSLNAGPLRRDLPPRAWSIRISSAELKSKRAEIVGAGVSCVRVRRSISSKRRSRGRCPATDRLRRAVGQIECGLRAPAFLLTRSARAKRLSQKLNFLSSFNEKVGFKGAAQKYISFVFSETMVICLHPASARGTFRPIVTIREAGCGGLDVGARRAQSLRT